jgi:CHAT domain-containing protein
MLERRATFPVVAVLILAVPSLAQAASSPALAGCLEQLARKPDGEAPALCLYELATGAGSEQAAAARRLEELAAEHPQSPWLLLYLGRVKWQTGDPAELREAERLYRRSAEVASRRGLAEAELGARRGLHRILRDAGRLEEARVEMERAVRIAAESGLPLLRLRADVLRAQQQSAEGEFEQAYRTLRLIQEDAEGHGPYDLVREHLFALAKAAQQTGRFREARGVYGILAERAAAAGDGTWEAQARYGMLAVRMLELHEMPSGAGRKETLELAHGALRAARAAGNPRYEAQSLWMLGSMDTAAEARAHLQRCFAVAATAFERSFCRSALARRLAATDPAAAEAAIHEALALAQESGNALARTSSWSERMRVSWALDPPKKALADGWAALDAIEALRDLQGDSEGQPGLFSTWAEDYYWLSGRLLEAGRTRSAFGVIERMRSRTLIDALGLSRRGPGVSPSLQARRADLFLEIAQVQRRLLDPSLPAGERERARAELDRLEIEAADLRARIAASDPAYAALSRPGFASLEQVRGALAPDEALLSFQIAPWEDLSGDFGGGSWLLVATRGGIRVYRLPGRTELRQAVNIFTGLFSARDRSEAEAAARLHGKLLRPALAELPRGIRRLVIVPDDFLHRLPFAALRPEPGGEALALRYEITLVPSATLWQRWRRPRPAPLATPALVLADPATLVTRGGAASKRSAIFLTPARLGKLPYARKEGAAVLRYLGSGELLMGEQASEAYLKENGAGAYGLVHFAAHAVTDDVHPDRSGVYLSPGDRREDGLLQAREIVDLDLDGRIVVLSACESASGEILRGEGVMGLARAFFQAGAHTVVASLWPLRDVDGAALFDRFYRHLAEGRSVAAALQAAQRDRMEAGAPAAAWAGVVVLGDGGRIPVPGGRGPGPAAWIAVGCGLLFATGLVLWRRGAAARSRRSRG